MVSKCWKFRIKPLSRAFTPQPHGTVRGLRLFTLPSSAQYTGAACGWPIITSQRRRENGLDDESVSCFSAAYHCLSASSRQRLVRSLARRRGAEYALLVDSKMAGWRLQLSQQQNAKMRHKRAQANGVCAGDAAAAAARAGEVSILG